MSKRPAARLACEAHKRARTDMYTIAHMANTSVDLLMCPETWMCVKVLPPSLEGYCYLRFTPAHEVYWHTSVASPSEFNSHIMVRAENTDWVRVSMRIKTKATCEVVFPCDETPCDHPILEIEFADGWVMDKETNRVSITGQPYVDSSSSGSDPDSLHTDDDASSDSE